MNNTNVSFQKYFLCNELSTSDIPSALKRGLSDITKISLNAFQKLRVGKKVPLVFATRYGSWQQVAKIEKQYYETDEFSPMIFSKLSNNITAGIISILTENNLPYTTISAGEKSFECGLLEAFLQESDDIIFLYAEEKSPSPMNKIVDQKSFAFAVYIQKNSDGNFFVKFREGNKSENIFDFINFLEKGNKLFETNFFSISRC